MSSGSIICAAIGRSRHKMMLIEMQEAFKRGAKMLELRLDYLARAIDFKRLLAARPCPLIATIRRPEDGGRWNKTEQDRLLLLRTAIVSGFDWVDLEEDVIDKIPRYGSVKRIVSYHNFRETPSDLEGIYKEMCKKDADVVKIAVTAQSTQDNLTVLKLLKNPPKPTVAIAMGEMGTCSRVLSGILGAPFTYGAFNKERAIAPGILSFAELQKIYHFESLKPDTKIFGVIGDPVGHSLSPLIHNAAFQKLGINAVYLPFRVPKGELTTFLQNYNVFPVQGYSVTIPHKEAVAKLPSNRDQSVEDIGAANTMYFQEGGWRTTNTDCVAAIESLRANLSASSTGETIPLGKRTILLLGAGGVAKALAFGLKKEGSNLIISNRTHERAEKLAEMAKCRYVDWEGRHSVICDTVINCTSVGMHPNVDESPLHGSFLKPGLMVFDTIYTPETTLLVREAKNRGCHVLTGVDMFVRQAALQFKLFTGQDPPITLMTQLVRRALSPVNYKEEPEGEAKPAEPKDEMNARIFLIGYRGSGKTTVGKLLAEALGWQWCDADVHLESVYGKTIRQIFADEGEPSFRDKETEILKELSTREKHVIATGGGVILRPENRALLKLGKTIWLTTAPAMIWRRLQSDDSTQERRPNLAQGGFEEIVSLLTQREPFYKECADLVIDTSSKEPDVIVREILKM